MTARKLLTALILDSSLLLLLASCPGNGGSAYSGGATYGGGDGSSGSEGGSSSYTAADLLNLSNSDDMEAVIRLVSEEPGSSGSAKIPAPAHVVLSASDIGLPSGGSVKLTMTVNGERQTYTARADADGNVSFDIPAVPARAEVSITMDVMTAAGVVLYSGEMEKEVSGTEDALAVTLETVIPPGNRKSISGTGWNGVADSSGGSTYLFEVNGYSFNASSPDATWGLAISISCPTPGTTTTVYMDITGTNMAIGHNHGGLKLFSGSAAQGGTINVIFCSSSTSTMEFGSVAGSYAMQVERVTANISVAEGCSISNMSIDGVTYTDADEFFHDAQAAGPGKRVKFTISKD